MAKTPKRKLIIGIDPGVNGALATLVDGRLVIWDLKPCYKPTGSFKSLDPEMFDKLIGSAFDYEYEPEDVTVFIEESKTFHKDGIKTPRPTYDSRGVMRSLFYLKGHKVEFIDPKTWKKHFGLLGTEKKDSVEKACFVFPKDKDFFTRPKRGGGVKMLDGRAEAALIAGYGAFTIYWREHGRMAPEQKLRPQCYEKSKLNP